jgi:hypothetical protein
MKRVTRQASARLALALALGSLCGPPTQSAAQVALPCIAQADGVSFRFEPAVFEGGASVWSLLSVGGDSFFYEADAFDQVSIQGGSSVKLKDRKGIDRTEPEPSQTDVKARLSATVTGTAPEFAVHLTLRDRDSDRTVTLSAVGSCLK